ncbi:hypothetical protein EV193_10338 [Herbihabitans rhizosphaerae]|uniref:BNR repeat protein n=1 Tax=Herbihabitans rhizosphaerae TaxID=1872711 RepID=A0A4Q7KVY1_9PSEU|nr:sialidase family protein [Herbihabitans rhizosphaerae]RZS40726.1 hypothetical protein EV193_10338 [Herbihabitans rhizosphaerae]
MRRRSRWVPLVTLALLGTAVAVPIATAPASAAPAQAERKLIHEGMGSYPRLIRLEHSAVAKGRIIASITSEDGAGRYAPIYESRDEGKTFTKISEVRDPEGGPGGMCCGTLYELPQQVGDMRKGTLLWAATYGHSAGQTRRVGIKVWSSRDAGRTWKYLAEPVRSHNHDGMYEPEFILDANGTLVMHFADETEAPKFAQVLNRVTSTDGVNWSTKQRTMAIPPDPVRPGMPIVRRLPDGRYYFAYEICNYRDRYCDPYFKISPDGANYGDPGAPGVRAQAAGGKHYEHAQTITLFPGAAPERPRILMVGQIYVDAKGKPLPGNGKTLLANDNLGEGEWYEVPAPVHVANPINDWCPNYSSTLLPVNGGNDVLQIAADYDNGTCRAYFATGPSR